MKGVGAPDGSCSAPEGVFRPISSCSELFKTGAVTPSRTAKYMKNKTVAMTPSPP